MEKYQEELIEKINNAIDAIINLEDYYPLGPKLSAALDELNFRRNISEEDIEAGDRVYDRKYKAYRIVSGVGTIWYFFNDGVAMGNVPTDKKDVFKVSL